VEWRDGRAGEVFDGEADGHTAFTDWGGGHSCSAGADVTDGEHTGEAAGLQQERVAAEPVPGLLIRRRLA
jgi:hypothetical protein